VGAVNNNTFSYVDAGDFNPGNIISDALFYNGGDMSVTAIQDFLEDQVPVCDTNGSLTTSSGASRAQVGINYGNPPPFTCMFEYSATTQERINDTVCDDIPAGTRTAAQMIYDVSVACDVSARAIIATIQKEQSLITDDWAWESQYRAAMGYGCPDSAPCATEYEGLFNQIWHGARQFRNYAINPSAYRYRAGQTINIPYHPSSSCGGATVTIQNNATAALYNYTPYQPNQAALDNLYTTGDSCSSYGNRNFWRLFNEWFGSTTGAVTVSRNLQFSPIQPKAGGLTAVSFIVRNTTSQPVTFDKLVVAVRNSRNENLNYPSQANITIQPGEEFTYYSRKRFYEADQELTFRIVAYRNNSWTYTWPESLQPNILRTRSASVSEPDIRISSSLNITPFDALTDESTTATFRLTNNEDRQIDAGKFVVAVRDEDSRNLNFQSIANIMIEPGETYTYTRQRSFNSSGSIRAYIVSQRPGQKWRTNWPLTGNSSVVTERELDIEQPDIRLTRNLVHSPLLVPAGGVKRVSFIVRNYEDRVVTIPKLVVAARDENNNNVNFPVIYNLQLNPGESYTYYQQRTMPNAGNHRIWITAYTHNGKWSKTWPFSNTSNILRERTYTIQ